MADIISSNLEHDKKDSWGTDPIIFKALHYEFNFTLDAAANDDNALCKNYFTINDNALAQDWSKHKSVWINPPYSRGNIKAFMAKAAEETKKGVTSVFLVPATLDAQWLPVSCISEIRIITGGRLSFYHPVSGKKISGNTKGSMFVIFKPNRQYLNIRLVDRDALYAVGNEV